MGSLRRVGSDTIVIGSSPESDDLADLPGLDHGEGADGKDDRASDTTRQQFIQAMQAHLRARGVIADEGDSSENSNGGTGIENGRTEVGGSSREPGSSQSDDARDGSTLEPSRAVAKRNSTMDSVPACSTEIGSKSQDQPAAGTAQQRDGAPSDDSEGHSSRSSSVSEETCTSEHLRKANGAKDSSMSTAERSARSERAKTRRELLSAISSNGEKLGLRSPDSFWPQLSGGLSPGFCPSPRSYPDGIHAAARRVLMI